MDGDHAASTAELFQSLTTQATDMAEDLNSLVRHYDLCTTALRHTEGGGEVIAQAKISLPTGLDLNRGQNTSPQPVTQEDREDMLQILDSDADQVDEVAHDIQERVLEMDSQCDQITKVLDSLREDNTLLVQAASTLGMLSQDLPRYINASSTFQSKWEEQKGRISDNLDEMSGIRNIYEGFLRAYDGLVLEIGRRHSVQKKIEKVVGEVMARLDQLAKADLGERSAFEKEHGEFLPSDLWAGLAQDHLRFEIHPVDHNVFDVPKLSQETVQKATQRSGKRA